MIKPKSKNQKKKRGTSNSPLKVALKNVRVGTIK